MFFLFPLRTDRWNGTLPLGTLVVAVLLVAAAVAGAVSGASGAARVAERNGMSAETMGLLLAGERAMGERAMQAGGLDGEREGAEFAKGDLDRIRGELAAEKESRRWAFVPSEGRLGTLALAPWICGGFAQLFWVLLALWLFGTAVETEFGTFRALGVLCAGQALTWGVLLLCCRLFAPEALDAAWSGPAAGVGTLAGLYVGRFPKSRVKWWMGWWFLKFKAVRFSTPGWVFALFWIGVLLPSSPTLAAPVGVALGLVAGRLSAKFLPARETRDDLTLTGDDETDRKSLERLETNEKLTSEATARAWKFLEANRFEQAGILIMRQIDAWIGDPAANEERLRHLLRRLQNQILNPKVLCVPPERVMEWARTLAKTRGWEAEVLYLLGWIAGSSEPGSAQWRQAKLAEAMVRLRMGAMPSMAADILRDLAKTGDAYGKRAAEILAKTGTKGGA